MGPKTCAPFESAHGRPLTARRSSGKTSIVEFVFRRMQARDTLYLDPSRKPSYTDFRSVWAPGTESAHSRSVQRLCRL